MYARVKVRAQEEPETIQTDESKSYVVRVIESLSLESYSSRILVSTHASRAENGSHSPHAKISRSCLKDSHLAKDNRGSSEDNKTKNNGFRKDNRCPKDSHLRTAINSKPHPKNLLTPSTAPSKGNTDVGSDDDNKINIRASSVPRPRAVLSSPDNDGIIGSQNQRIREKQTPLRRITLKSDEITSQKSELLKAKRTVNIRQTSSPKTEPQTRPSRSKLERPHSAGKISSSSSSDRGKRLSELSTPRQRPPFKVV